MGVKQGLVELGMYREQENSHLERPDHTLHPTWPPFSPTSLYTYTPVRKFTDRKNVWHTIYEYNKTRNSLCCRFHVVYLFLPNAFIDFYWLLVTTALLWYNC